MDKDRKVKKNKTDYIRPVLHFCLGLLTAKRDTVHLDYICKWKVKEGYKKQRLCRVNARGLCWHLDAWPFDDKETPYDRIIKSNQTLW